MEKEFINSINNMVGQIDKVSTVPEVELDKDLEIGVKTYILNYPTAIEYTSDDMLDNLNETCKVSILLYDMIEQEGLEPEMISFGINDKDEIIFAIHIVEDIEGHQPILVKYFENNIGRDVKVSLPIGMDNKEKYIVTIRVINVVENALMCDYYIEKTVPSGYIDGNYGREWREARIDLKYKTSTTDIAKKLI